MSELFKETILQADSEHIIAQTTHSTRFCWTSILKFTGGLLKTHFVRHFLCQFSRVFT